MNIKYIKSTIGTHNYIAALDKNKMVGYLWYNIKLGEAWLYFIYVNKEYRHLKNEKIGSKLLEIFENDCLKKLCRSVEGKFFPEGEEYEVVKKFYENNGYSIDKEYYDTFVSKPLKRSSLTSLDAEEIDYNKFNELYHVFSDEIKDDMDEKV